MKVFVGKYNIVSPLGFTANENFNAVLQGKSAVAKHKFDFSESLFCCSALDQNLINQRFSNLSKNSAYTKLEKMSILSIADVVEQSKIDLKDKNTLLIVSTTKGNIDVLEKKYPQLNETRAYLSEFAKTLADHFGFINSPLIVSNACISGLLAIIIGGRMIEAGHYKNVVVCGADLVTEFTLSGFKSFNALSEELCRPFDAHRVGINLGECAATIALSSENISDIVLTGGSSANDANHISGPSRTGDGLFKAISGAMNESGQGLPDFISAHGTATEYNDEMEAIAFQRSGLSAIPVNSLKGFYGHTLGAAGILETILSLLSLKNNTLIASKGFEELGVSVALPVLKENRNGTFTSFMKTASGFGGCNAAAIFRKTG